MRTTIALLVAAALAAAMLGAFASASSASRSTGEKNIVETAIAAGRFTTLTSLLTKAGLADTLATGGPFTVFAPTDAAFAKVPKATLAGLAKHPAQLKAVLLYHVVPGSVTASEVVKLSSAKTLEGSSVLIKANKGGVFVNQAKVTTPDVMASNGVIHVINKVLIPPKNIVATAKAAGKFTTLAALLKKSGLAGTLAKKGPFTVFAPTDAAFAKVPKASLAALAKNKAKLRAVLLYHVVKGQLTAGQAMKLRSAKTLEGKSLKIRVKGGKVIVGGATVTKADVLASNGVIHAINKVLIP
ncbi:MAG TPA: fasciclin domain-containing protein [Gaiellaceae bacterium]|nr:fasciclin domain-containing protein [Gaiellaceae bacterium]